MHLILELLLIVFSHPRVFTSSLSLSLPRHLVLFSIIFFVCCLCAKWRNFLLLGKFKVNEKSISRVYFKCLLANSLFFSFFLVWKMEFIFLIHKKALIPQHYVCCTTAIDWQMILIFNDARAKKMWRKMLKKLREKKI